jgi:hypothetical protein
MEVLRINFDHEAIQIKSLANKKAMVNEWKKYLSDPKRNSKEFFGLKKKNTIEIFMFSMRKQNKYKRIHWLFTMKV